MPFSRNYHLIQFVGSANKRARTSAPAGDIHGSSILCRVADIAWPAVKTGPGDGRFLSWQHDRAGVRSPTFVRVWGACRAESTRRAAAGEFTKGEGRVKTTFFLDKFRGACYDPSFTITISNQQFFSTMYVWKSYMSIANQLVFRFPVN